MIGGDLRALYLLWLCAADDDYNDPAEMIEPPVPHGISDMATHGGELLSFFGLDPFLLLAAGQDVEAAPTDESKDQALARWVRDLNGERSKDLLLQLLSGDTVSVKANLLAEARDSQTPANWPTTDRQRSLGELLRQTEVLRSNENTKQARKAKAKAKREAAKADRKRKERMKEMVQDPEGSLSRLQTSHRQAEMSVRVWGRNYVEKTEQLCHSSLGQRSVPEQHMTPVMFAKRGIEENAAKSS